MRIIPLGGYCAFDGEDGDDEDEKTDEKGGEIAKSEDEPFEELTAKDGENTQNDGGMSALKQKIEPTVLQDVTWDDAVMQEEIFGDSMREVERVIMLQVVDRHWMQHIDDLAQLREGISLRAYAQHDPVVEYQSVSSEMFDEMNASIREETVRGVLNVRKRNDATERKQVAKAVSTGESKEVVKKPVVNEEGKIGRNDPCPCGSGKKYKVCCMDK